jgi:hypothetical protein
MDTGIAEFEVAHFVAKDSSSLDVPLWLPTFRTIVSPLPSVHDAL